MRRSAASIAFAAVYLSTIFFRRRLARGSSFFPINMILYSSLETFVYLFFFVCHFRSFFDCRTWEIGDRVQDSSVSGPGFELLVAVSGVFAVLRARRLLRGLRVNVPRQHHHRHFGDEAT